MKAWPAVIERVSDALTEHASASLQASDPGVTMYLDVRTALLCLLAALRVSTDRAASRQVETAVFYFSSAINEARRLGLWDDTCKHCSTTEGLCRDGYCARCHMPGSTPGCQQ